jgi:microcystin-dependent protein
MESLYLANSLQTQPEVPSDVPAGYPTDGSSTGGVPATVPGAIWYNGVTMEIVNAIRAGGITPTRNDNTQLAQSIQALIDALRSDIEAQIADISGNIFVPGTIAYFGMPDAPANWLVCNGQAVSRTTYSNLFETIGTTYGDGNGSTTFNLPNLINRVAWGATSNVGTSVAAGLPDIVGEFSGLESADPAQSIATGAFSFTDTVANGAGHRNSDDHTLQFKASDSNAIYGNSNTVQPPAVRLLPCIHI